MIEKQIGIFGISYKSKYKKTANGSRFDNKGTADKLYASIEYKSGVFCSFCGSSNY